MPAGVHLYFHCPLIAPWSLFCYIFFFFVFYSCAINRVYLIESSHVAWLIGLSACDSLVSIGLISPSWPSSFWPSSWSYPHLRHQSHPPASATAVVVVVVATNERRTGERAGGRVGGWVGGRSMSASRDKRTTNSRRNKEKQYENSSDTSSVSWALIRGQRARTNGQTQTPAM